MGITAFTVYTQLSATEYYETNVKKLEPRQEIVCTNEFEEKCTSSLNSLGSSNCTYCWSD